MTSNRHNCHIIGLRDTSIWYKPWIFYQSIYLQYNVVLNFIGDNLSFSILNIVVKFGFEITYICKQLDLHTDDQYVNLVGKHLQGKKNLAWHSHNFVLPCNTVEEYFIIKITFIFHYQHYIHISSIFSMLCS